MGDEMDSLTFFPRASASHGAGMCLLDRFLSRFPFAPCMRLCICVPSPLNTYHRASHWRWWRHRAAMCRRLLHRWFNL